MSDFIINENDVIYDIWNADKTTRRYRNELFRTYQILRLVKSIPESVNTVLDIGCGTGKLAVEIAERNKDMKISALDISEKRLKMFADQAQKYAIRQVQQDFSKFQTDPVDLLISQEVLEHLPDVEKAMKKMRTFIRSGGFAIFCVPYEENLESKMITDPVTGERYHKNGHLHRFTRSSFIDYAEVSGFKVLKVKLNANKRLVRWFTKLNVSVTPATCGLDDLMNRLFPHKSAYIAILCRNMNA